jgi:peptide/nickel transport system substrate-binding protein
MQGGLTSGWKPNPLEPAIRNADREENAMTERDLWLLLDQVRHGELSRRHFVERMLGLGVSVPMAGMMLMQAGVASAQSAPYKPARRGGGGTLRILQSEAPTLLNPHFATGAKDGFGSRIFYEPLAQWDADANLEAVLAAEIPSLENGGVAADARSVIWKLKRGVSWHDGEPFTADDVIFNWQYATDPTAATVSIGGYRNLKMEKIDSHTVRVIFNVPSPFWPGQYSQLMLVPKHLFATYSGAKSRDAPNNNRPVGTGAYTFVDFKPGDSLRASLNPRYHQANRPHFDQIDLKGGGDSASAARAVLQTGEYDYAGSLTVEDEVLKRMEAGGKGRVQILNASATSAIYLNFADPGTEVDGERSNPKSRHPVFSDARVRRAIGHLVDRPNIETHVYGRLGVATTNYINLPVRYRSTHTSAEFNIAKAVALLEEAGWKAGVDGVRAKNGKRLELLYQTAVGAIGQKIQLIIKQAAQKAGIQVELKVIPPSVFFSSDIGNPDTYGKFHADIQGYNWTNDSPDPEALMQCFVSWETCSKANKWLGQNILRWQNAEFDALFRAAEVELDPVKRAALFIQMNDLVVGDGYVVPIVVRRSARAMNRSLVAPLSGWQSDIASLPHWYMEL